MGLTVMPVMRSPPVMVAAMPATLTFTALRKCMYSVVASTAFNSMKSIPLSVVDSMTSCRRLRGSVRFVVISTHLYLRLHNGLGLYENVGDLDRDRRIWQWRTWSGRAAGGRC